MAAARPKNDSTKQPLLTQPTARTLLGGGTYGGLSSNSDAEVVSTGAAATTAKFAADTLDSRVGPVQAIQSSFEIFLRRSVATRPASVMTGSTLRDTNSSTDVKQVPLRTVQSAPALATIANKSVSAQALDMKLGEELVQHVTLLTTFAEVITLIDELAKPSSTSLDDSVIGHMKSSFPFLNLNNQETRNTIIKEMTKTIGLFDSYKAFSQAFSKLEQMSAYFAKTPYSNNPAFLTSYSYFKGRYEKDHKTKVEGLVKKYGKYAPIAKNIIDICIDKDAQLSPIKQV